MGSFKKLFWRTSRLFAFKSFKTCLQYFFFRRCARHRRQSYQSSQSLLRQRMGSNLTGIFIVACVELCPNLSSLSNLGWVKEYTSPHFRRQTVLAGAKSSFRLPFLCLEDKKIGTQMTALFPSSLPFRSLRLEGGGACDGGKREGRRTRFFCGFAAKKEEGELLISRNRHQGRSDKPKRPLFMWEIAGGISWARRARTISRSDDGFAYLLIRGSSSSSSNSSGGHKSGMAWSSLCPHSFA